MTGLRQLRSCLANFRSLPAPTPLEFPHGPFRLHGKTKTGHPLQQLCANKSFGTINQSSWCWGHLCIYMVLVWGFHFSQRSAWLPRLNVPTTRVPESHLKDQWFGGFWVLVINLCSVYQAPESGWRLLDTVNVWTPCPFFWQSNTQVVLNVPVKNKAGWWYLDSMDMIRNNLAFTFLKQVCVGLIISLLFSLTL